LQRTPSNIKIQLHLIFMITTLNLTTLKLQLSFSIFTITNLNLITLKLQLQFSIFIITNPNQER